MIDQLTENLQQRRASDRSDIYCSNVEIRCWPLQLRNTNAFV